MRQSGSHEVTTNKDSDRSNPTALYLRSSPPDTIVLLAVLQSTAKMTPSWAFQWVGFAEGWSGLITRDFPLV